MPCVAIKANGIPCGKGTGPLCGTHQRQQALAGGPAKYEVDQMRVVHANELRLLKVAYKARIQNNPDRTVGWGVDQKMLYDHTRHTVRQRQILAETELIIRHEAELDAANVNPDADADVQARIARRDRDRINNAMAPAARDDPVLGYLGQMAADPQNVHTTRVVEHTKAIIDRVLTIHVPEPYRWNTTTCSLTPGEIMFTCKLSPTAAWQMSAKYCQAETIYEYSGGIYGRVLDSVWQFILDSPDKEDMCRGLRQEMEDNIGMCAQGNLSRLCNILSGYLDGVVITESVAERMGRLLPPLLEIDDDDLRFLNVLRILKTEDVPKSEWIVWAEPLFPDQRIVFTDEDVLVIH